jgi:hypothetical protein
MFKCKGVGVRCYKTLKAWALLLRWRCPALSSLLRWRTAILSHQNADTIFSPIHRIAFDDSTHKLWYTTWWDGKCVGVGLFCVRDAHWDTLVKPSLDQRHPTVDQNALVKSLCTLGQLIGLEWARDNSIRCVHTSDVQRWNALILAASADVLPRIEVVRSEANAMIARARPERPCAR